MTRLQPLTQQRAEELFGLLKQASEEPNTGLALDDGGNVLGTVSTDDPDDAVQPHVLGDLDVHA